MSEWQDLSNHVFGNELLLELILNFTIKKKNIRSVVDVRNCRLVNSIWLKTVNKCLRKSKMPIFALTLHPRNPIKRLEKFEYAVSNIVFAEERLPPTSLYIWSSCFEQENIQPVIDVLARVSKCLVSLLIAMSPKGCPALAPNVSIQFPVLHSLEIQIYSGNFYEGNAFGGNFNVASFIQVILSGSQNLKNFTLRGGIWENQRLPLGFTSLSFPSTLTKLKFKLGLSKENCRELLQVDLPNITNLVLPRVYHISGDSLIDCILSEQLSRTLKKLSMNGDVLYDRSSKLSLVALPIMTSLECLCVKGQMVPENLDGSWNTEISKMFPSLKKIKCNDNFSFDIICIWMENLWSESIEEVCILSNLRCMNNLKLKSTQFLSLAFPNVCKLNLTYNLDLDVDNLRFLFCNFNHIKDFTLTIRTRELRCIKCCKQFRGDRFSSFFLGITEKEARYLGKRIKTGKRSYNLDDVPERRSRKEALTDMNGLQKLFLTTTGYLGGPLPIDSVLQYGLDYLPDIKIIRIGGDFQVSEATIMKSKQRGRVVAYLQERI